MVRILVPLGTGRCGYGQQPARPQLAATTVQHEHRPVPGGQLGAGLGQGNSDLIGFAANADFILSTVGEELGLAGTMAFLLIYGLIVERGIRTSLAARDPFGKLLAIGLTGAFAIQVFVVAGGVMGLIPLTGMTLPFVAYGGSSVLANWALIGILIRISDTARSPAPASAPSSDAEMSQVVRP
jgi:cell division protein FtsW (lipid II flippase)